MLATAIVFLGVIAAYIVHLGDGTAHHDRRRYPLRRRDQHAGLGAAQQAYADMTGIDAPDIATGYAVAYPLGVIGIILSMLFIRWIFRIRFDEEIRYSRAARTTRASGPRFGRSQKPVSRRQNRSADQATDKPSVRHLARAPARRAYRDRQRADSAPRRRQGDGRHDGR